MVGPTTIGEGTHMTRCVRPDTCATSASATGKAQKTDDSMSLRRRLLPAAAAGYDCIDGLCISAPPPATNTTYSDSDSTPITFRHKSRLVPNLLFAAAALLLLSFLLLLSTYAIHRFTRRRRRRILASSAAAASPTGADDDDDDGDSYVADHHVWNIRTVGLDDATIRSIAACVYNAKEGLLGGGQADCAVCLGELSDGELLRLLPKCGHAFHLPCVDTWLRAHVNCPLCRAPVLAPPPPPPPPDVETSVSESTPSVVADDTPELKITIGIELAEFGSSSANSGLLNNLGEDGLQPVRRSVSMDSSSLAALLLRGDSIQKPTEEGVVTEIGEQQAVKNMGKQGKGPVQMKRSMSTRSGRFFLSRHARTRNSVIPL